MKSILVPVDYSDCSDQAMKFAWAMCQKFNAEITLLHVQGIPMTDPYAGGESIYVQEKQVETQQKELLMTRWEQVVGKEANSCPIVPRLHLGFAAGEISYLAEEEKVDCIVMGTHGRSGLFSEMMGSVSTAVLAKVDIPVILVPDYNRFEDMDVPEKMELDRILFAIDEIPDEEEEWETLTKFGEAFDSQIRVVHIVGEEDVTMTGVTAGAFRKLIEMDSGVDVMADAISGQNVEDSIQDYIEEKEIDMLVMKKSHRNFFDRLIHPSQVRKMALHTTIPLMVLP